MTRGPRVFWLAAAAAAIAIATSWGAVSAQTAPAAPGTGLVFADDATYATVPKRSRTRGVVAFDRIDLSGYFPTPGNQMNQGSCAAWAVGYGVRSYYLANDLGRRLTPQESVSPSFIFNQTTPAARNPQAACSGVNIPDTLGFLKDNGALPMSAWPYNPTTCRPNSVSQEEAARAGSLRIPSYSAFRQDELRDARRYREVLAKGHPIIVAMSIVYAELVEYRGGTVFSSTSPLDANRVGHGMVIVGYDDEKRAFLLYNSWGDRWGENGKIWMHYDTLLRWVREAYVVDGLPPPAGVFAAAHSVPPAPAVAPPRERLQAIARQARCGVLRVEAGDRLVGFAGPGETDAIIRAASEINPAAAHDVREAAWPACEAMKTLADAPSAGLSARVAPLGATDSGPASGPMRLQSGERFRIEVTAPADSRHLQIYYLQSDRSAKRIFSGEAQLASDGQRRVTLGDTVLGLRASEPFGPEALVVLAADGPVIEGESTLNLEEHAFLQQLAEGVRKRPGRVHASFRTIEVMGPDAEAAAGRWLLTPYEARSLSEVAGSDAPAPPSETSYLGQPGRVLVQPSPSGGALAVQASLGAISGPRNLKLAYRSATGLLDVTTRIASLGRADATGIALENVRLPPGRHRFRLSAEDAAGRPHAMEFTLTGAP